MFEFPEPHGSDRGCFSPNLVAAKSSLQSWFNAVAASDDDDDDDDSDDDHHTPAYFWYRGSWEQKPPHR